MTESQAIKWFLCNLAAIDESLRRSRLTSTGRLVVPPVEWLPLLGGHTKSEIRPRKRRRVSEASSAMPWVRELQQAEHEMRTVALVEWGISGTRRDAVARWASVIREAIDRLSTEGRVEPPAAVPQGGDTPKGE